MRYVVRMSLTDGVPHEIVVLKSKRMANLLVWAGTTLARKRGYGDQRRYWVTAVGVSA